MKKLIFAVTLLLLAAPVFGGAGIKDKGATRDWSLNVKVTNGTGTRLQGVIIKGARFYKDGKGYTDFTETSLNPNQSIWLTGDRGKTYNKMIIKLGERKAAFGMFTNIGIGTAYRRPTVSLVITKQGERYFVNNPISGKREELTWTIIGDLSDLKKICY